jgi:radical SAM protein with 4Fe4S-binding SPASM domain
MRTFSIELTTTNRCSFRCSYCFESEFKEGINLLNIDSDKLIIRLRQLINSEWLRSVADQVSITFWGGEPSLNTDLIYKVVDEFADDERVHFYIYTNGSRITQLLPSLMRADGRFRVQVSYDGYPIHNMRRRTVDDKPTSNIVINAFETLKRYNIPFSIKSTITYQDFDYIQFAWDDLEMIQAKHGNHIHYALTVDYHNVNFEDYRDRIEAGLLLVAKREYNYFREYGEFLSNIFVDQKRTCNTSYMVAIDTKGNMYPCHGGIYSNEDLMFGNIFANNFLEAVKGHHNRFSYDKVINEECSNCIALNCIRCHIKKFELSEKEDFKDRWNDYTAQENLCAYYKLSGKIGRGLYMALREV